MANEKDKKPDLDAEVLAAENAALKQQLAEATQLADTGGFTKDDLELVAHKVAAGLSPEQAKEVVRNQKRHDASLTKK
jgi:hypothetical protein